MHGTTVPKDQKCDYLHARMHAQLKKGKNKPGRRNNKERSCLAGASAAYSCGNS